MNTISASATNMFTSLKMRMPLSIPPLTEKNVTTAMTRIRPMIVCGELAIP